MIQNRQGLNTKTSFFEEDHLETVTQWSQKMRENGKTKKYVDHVKGSQPGTALEGVLPR